MDLEFGIMTTADLTRACERQERGRQSLSFPFFSLPLPASSLSLCFVWWSSPGSTHRVCSRRVDGILGRHLFKSLSLVGNKWTSFHINSLLCIFKYLDSFLRFYLFTFRERGREGEREGEKNRCVRDTSIGCLPYAPDWGSAPTSPCMCPDWELNGWPFGSQAGAQCTEPHQPGLHSLLECWVLWFI